MLSREGVNYYWCPACGGEWGVVPSDTGQPILEPYELHEGRKFLRALWVLTHDRKPALACILLTHRLGWYLRLISGTKLIRARVCRTEREVQEFSEGWRLDARAKGWTGEVTDPTAYFLSEIRTKPPEP
jgi:hypothetical protein